VDYTYQLQVVFKNNNMKKISYIAVLFFGLTLACDKIDDPIPANLGTSVSLDGDVEFISEPEFNLNDSNALKGFITNNVWDTANGADNSNRRFIVLEEFTGQKCSSCPRGAREISRLKTIFGEQLIPVGIHTGFFATPNPPGSTMYTTDFRAPGGHGAEYVRVFKVSGNPRGIVNRVGIAKAETQWEADIIAVKDDAPDAVLSLSNYYDSINHVVRSQVEIDWNTTSTSKYHLQLYVIEGKIIDWQLDGSTDVSDYEHKFVLRKVVNSTFGKELNPAMVGGSEKFQYIFQMDMDWKAKNSEVVAFIFNNDESAYDVIQANSAYVKK